MSRSVHTTLKSWAAKRGKREIDESIKLGDADLDELLKKRRYKRTTRATRQSRGVRRQARK